MDLTLEAAFSPGGMVGHLAYFLLILSMLMTKMSLLRILVIASALVSIVYDWVWLRDPVGVFWEGLLVTVNVVQLAILHWKNITAKFDEDESRFIGGKFPGLSPSHCRKLLDNGEWVECFKGEVLTQEGVPSEYLIYVSEGVVEIFAHGRKVSQCEADTFIGEITVLNQHPATATTKTLENTRIWRITRDKLERLVRRNPDIGRELEASFARNYRDKLIQSNQLIAKGVVP